MNKRGFDCALSRANSRCLFADSLLPLVSYAFLSHFCSCTYQVSHHYTFHITLAYQSLFYTTTPRIFSWELSPKSNFYFTD